MHQSFYHFDAKRPAEELILDENHKLAGHVAQYLTNFQLEGIRFLFKHFKNNQSCILNDESGLGKTAIVCAFLESVLPHDSTRNCLVIVKNDEWIKNWKFHLDTLTRLSTKIIFKDKDVDKEMVYLTKWDSLQKSASLANCDFDCIVIDNRGDLMANRICSGYLLRNYESKISLIVSSSDVAVDLRQFHTMLRLCGRLDKNLEDLKSFEDKFSLPTITNSGDVNLLEAYFLRREKIINFCREFRMRRYRHQYEDELPLVQPDIYLKSLNAWAQNPLCNSVSSSSSVRVLTSSSEKDVEQLLKSYFNPREEMDLNIEISKITAKAERGNKQMSNHGDLEHMSPLLFESDTEDRELEARNQSPALPEKASKEFIIPILKENGEDNKSSTQGKQRQQRRKKVIPLPQHKRSTRTAAKVEQNKLTIEKKEESLPRLTRLRKERSKNKKNLRTLLPDRNLRSHHATRSKSLKSKYLIIDLTDDELLKIQKSRRNRTKRKAVTCTKNEKIDENKKIRNKKEPRNIEVRTRSNIKKLNFKIADNPDRINKSKRTAKRKLADSTRTMSSEASEKHEKIAAKLYVEKPKAVEKSSKKKSTIKNTSSNKTKAETELKNSDDVHFVSPQDHIIVLSSSTDECTSPSRNDGMKKTFRTKIIRPSPDIFSNVVDECDITCSQKSKLSSELKSLGSMPKQRGMLKNPNLSCLDLLENEFQKEKRNTIRETEEIFEISTSETFKNILQMNDHSSEVTPIRSRSVTYQKNKITKYLIGPEDLSPSLESTQSEVTEFRKNGDNYPKTPIRPRIQKSSSTSKKSPKTTCPRDITPNSLTKWLIKSDSTNGGVNKSKSSKRRRLDLWFSD